MTGPVLLRRAFDLALKVDPTDGDGRTVTGRVVPYGETIVHQDGPGQPIYRERFVRGALADMGRYLHRVKLGMEHESGYLSNVGKAIAIDDQLDGAHVTFRLYEHDAEKARDHLESTHEGLSLEFYNTGPIIRSADGVVERTRVRVYRVAALTEQAYKGAKVLAVRSAAEPVEGEQDNPQDGQAPQEPPQPVYRARLDEALAIRAEIERARPDYFARDAP
jgi:phage head maturation protease